MRSGARTRPPPGNPLAPLWFQAGNRTGRRDSPGRWRGRSRRPRGPRPARAGAAQAWLHRLTRIGLLTALTFGGLFALTGLLVPGLFPRVGSDVHHIALIGILINAATQVFKVRNMIIGGGVLPSAGDGKGVIIGDVVGSFVVGLPLAIGLGLWLMTAGARRNARHRKEHKVLERDAREARTLREHGTTRRDHRAQGRPRRHREPLQHQHRPGRLESVRVDPTQLAIARPTTFRRAARRRPGARRCAGRAGAGAGRAAV